MPFIAISGAQSTGKSTVLSMLPYPHVSRKTSRSILNEWGVKLSEVNNNRQLTVKFQDEILNRKIQDDRIASDTSEVMFTERTPMDFAVYAVVALGKDNEYSEWLDAYVARCFQAMDIYDHVFYLNAGQFKPVHDGVRATNEHYNKLVALYMEHLYARYNADGLQRFNVSKLTRISTADKVERITIIEDVVARLKQL